MTSSQEFYAESVEEAVRKAAARLGVTAEELEYEILDEGAAGFLGIGARDARIVVRSSGASPEPLSPDLPEPVLSEPEAAEPADGDALPHDDEASSEPQEGAGDSSSALAEAVSAPTRDGRTVEESGVAPPEVLEHVERLVSEVVEAMGLEARVDVYDAGDYIAADVAPDHTALFIGQKGETIDALQYLVNASVYRKTNLSKRVILDAEGYRQRRVEAIQGMAHRTARRALREKRTVELPPMSAAERRVVHIFLRDNPNVSTESEGTGENRRVRVSPAG